MATIKSISNLQEQPHDWPVNNLYNAPAAREKNVIGVKIAEARKDRNLNQRQLVALLSEYGVNVQIAALSKWEKGENVPNGYQMLALCHALRIETGLEYFTGKVSMTPIEQADPDEKKLNLEGRKMLDSFKGYLMSNDKFVIKEAPLPYIVLRKMPVFDMGASAGPGEFVDDGHYELKQFPANQIPDEADFSVRVAGTSMEPVFSDGQYVWVQKCDSLRDGEIGIFCWNDSAYIKMYHEEEPESVEEFTDSEGVLHKQIQLISYNTADSANLPKIIGPWDTFKILGRVIQ